MTALKNPKHEAFCREVAGGASHAHAWILSGNNPNANNVTRMVRHPRIQQRIAELREEFNRSAGIQLRWLQEKLLPLATSDVTAYFEVDKNGKPKLKDLERLPAEVRAALSEFRIDASGNITIKTHDKKGAIDSLIKPSAGSHPSGSRFRRRLKMWLRRPNGPPASTCVGLHILWVSCSPT